MAQRIVPLWNSSNKGRSVNVSGQKRINLYAERYPDADKSPLVLYSRPGLTPQLFPDGERPGPIRGWIRCQKVTITPFGDPVQSEMIYAASGSTCLLSDNAPTGFIGSDVYQTTSGPMVFADNGLEVISVDGVSGYLAGLGSFQFDLAGSPASADFPFGAKSVCYLAGRFICDDPFSPGRVRYSDLLDGATWPGANFFTAESIPDALTAVWALRGEFLLFGSRSLEFWQPSEGTLPFTRVSGAGEGWGLYRASTIADLGDVLIFCGTRESADVEVCALQGYQVQVVSTPDVEYDINQTLKLGGEVSAMPLRIGGHMFYVLNMPSKTWVLDVNSGQWDEWQTEGARFAGQLSLACYGRTQVSDYRDARIYATSLDRYVDDAQPMVREVTFRHVFADLNRITVDRLQLDCDTGLGGPMTTITYPRALVFTGGGAATATSATVGVTTVSFSVELWVLLPAGLPANQMLLARNGPTPNPGFRLYTLGGNQLRADGFPSPLGSPGVGNSTIPYTPDVWTHIAFTYQTGASILTSYVNAVLVQQLVPVLAPMNNGVPPLNVTVGWGSTGTALTGKLGLIRIWNGVRTIEQIAASMTVVFEAGTLNLVNQWSDFAIGATSIPSIGSDDTPLVLGGTATTGVMEAFGVTSERTAQVMMQVSKDRGHTFGNEFWRTLGNLGQYKKTVAWNGLGLGDDLTFRVRVADPVAVTMSNAALLLRE